MFHEVFVITARTFVVEMKSLSQKVDSLHRAKSISFSDSKLIGKGISKALDQFSDIVDQASNNVLKTKSEWVNLLEGIFQLTASTINSIMMKYVQHRIK